MVRTSLKTAIILVNYNTAQDTIECIHSLVNCLSANYVVIVVDNHSSDDSVSQLDEHIKQYSSNLVQLIAAKENLGFAAGNNLGVSHALSMPHISHFWFLNNDTILKDDALSPLIDQFERNNSSGLLGSKLLYYNPPHKLQAVGGRINVVTAKVSLVGFNEEDHGQYDQEEHTLIDYVVGASMFTSKQVIEKVGKMNEKLFLYVEELDWCKRMKVNGLSIDYCPKSVIYHKQGVSTKQFERGQKSQMATFYQIRNLIYHYRLFYPLFIFSPIIRMLLRAVLYTLNEKQNFIKVYLRATRNSFRM